MKFKIKEWAAFTTWMWDIPDYPTCTICQQSFENPCPKCKMPGDDCAPVEGACDHYFHLHCIMQWLEQGKEECPLCRVKWHEKTYR